MAMETIELYAMLIHIPSKRYNANLPKSVEVEFVDRSRGCLDVSASYLGAICGMVPSYHGNTSADVTKKLNIENTNKFLLTTLWYSVVIE